MFPRTRLCSRLMLAFGGTLLIGSLPAEAQDAQRIEITGSAIRRIDAESTLPVTVVTKEDIARSGATTAYELLDKLSANNGGGYNQALAVGDSARPGFAGASLRGLGPNTTLILLNGRRLAVYAFDGGGVDLNAIALGAIERVEVLRDGASALYGTDAIAGVINFITRNDFNGVELNAVARLPEKTGGRSYQAGVTFGFGDLTTDRFNVFGNLSFDKADALKAIQRDYSKTSYLPSAPGGVFDRTSGNTVPASVQTPAGVLNPGVPNCLPPASFQTTPTGACRFDYASVIDLLSPQEKTGGLLRGTFQLNADTQLFAEFNKTRTETTFRSSPTPASSATTFAGDDVVYPAGGRWYPMALNPATGLMEPGILNHLDGSNAFVPLAGNLPIFWRSLDAGPRTNRAVADQDRIVIGARGTFRQWDYDVGLMRAQSKVTEHYVEGYLYESKLLNSTCDAPPCGPLSAGYAVGTMNPDINPFGPNDAAGLAALRASLVTGPVRISRSTRTAIDGKVSGELFQLPAGPVTMAVGGERRTERFDDNPLAVLNSGDIIGGGGNQAPIDGKRTVTAVFTEFSVPVMKGVEGLLQVRHDRYSDFGNTTNPKIGFRWQPTTSVLVRGSAGAGFRAPTLPDLLAPITQTNSGNNYNDPLYEAKVGDCYNAAGQETIHFTPRYCNTQLTVNQGGNPDLQPEKSRQASLGLVFQPSRDVSVGIDLWRIKIRGQIGIPDPDERLATYIAQFMADPNVAYSPTTSKLSAAGRAALLNNPPGEGIVIDPVSGYLDYVSARFANVATTVTSGVDLSARVTFLRNASGVFSASLESSYLDSLKQDGEELAGQYSQYGPVVRWRHQLSLDWQRGPWTAGATYNYSQGYRDQGGTRDVSPWQTIDLALSYKGLQNLTLRAGVQNLFDKTPPYTRQGDYFQVGYDPTVADPRGRTYTLAVNYQFR